MTTSPPTSTLSRFGTAPIAKASVRCVAYTIEAAVFMFLTFVPVVGPIIATAYIMCRDGIYGGQSPIKKLLGLRVVHFSTRTPIGYRESIIRSWPLAVGPFISIIPFVGQLIGVGLATFVFVLELILMLSSPSRRRFGDRMADTLVISEAVPK